MEIIIYHNPRCSKSRQTLAILNEKGIEPEIVLYLDNPPNAKEIEAICQKIDISPEQLVRKGETLFKELGSPKDLSDEQWCKLMAENPKLIERPIVIKGGKAALGRPPENVLKILS